MLLVRREYYLFYCLQTMEDRNLPPATQIIIAQEQYGRRGSLRAATRCG